MHCLLTLHMWVVHFSIRWVAAADLHVFSASQVTEAEPIVVSIGEAPPILVSSSEDWPESLHKCSVPSSAEGEVTVKVRVQHLEAVVTLRGACVGYSCGPPVVVGFNWEWWALIEYFKGGHSHRLGSLVCSRRF